MWWEYFIIILALVLSVTFLVLRYKNRIKHPEEGCKNCPLASNCEDKKSF